MPYDPIPYPDPCDDQLRAMIDTCNGVIQDANASLDTIAALQDQVTQKDGTILDQLGQIGDLGRQLAACQQNCAETIPISLYGFNITHADGSVQFVLCGGNDAQDAHEKVQAQYPDALCYENGGLFGNLGAFSGTGFFFSGPVYGPGS